MKQPIDRKALEAIRALEGELSAFHGIRHFWSNQIANYRMSIHTDVTIDPDVLMAEQYDRLWSAIGAAMELHHQLWPENEETPHRAYAHLVDRMAR